MADQQTILIKALSTALETSGSNALFNKKNAQGLFPLSAPGKLAAQTCIQLQWLKVLEQSTKANTEIVQITPLGVGWLLGALKIESFLENAVILLEKAKSCTSIKEDERLLYERMGKSINLILEKSESIPPSSFSLNQQQIFLVLKEWAESGRVGDCQLSNLYRQLQKRCPQITLGLFHDALRELRHKKLVELHPWTGPLYEIPEPQLALMAGHEVAYYASLGSAATSTAAVHLESENFNSNDRAIAYCSAG